MPAGSPERRFFDLLEILDTTTMLPIALLLFRDPDVDEERRRGVLTTLEDFLVRRMICGWTTKNYNRLAADIVAVIKDNPGTPDSAVGDFLAAQDAPANQWLNSSLSNSPWSLPHAANDKRRALAKHSVLLLNTRLVDENPDSFDERAIDCRGEQLTGKVLQIWPGPPSSASGLPP